MTFAIDQFILYWIRALGRSTKVSQRTFSTLCRGSNGGHGRPHGSEKDFRSAISLFQFRIMRFGIRQRECKRYEIFPPAGELARSLQARLTERTQHRNHLDG